MREKKLYMSFFSTVVLCSCGTYWDIYSPPGSSFELDKNSAEPKLRFFSYMLNAFYVKVFTET
jgi:hypothetical protein